MEQNRKSFWIVLSVILLDDLGFSMVFILFANLVLNPEYGFFGAEIPVSTKNMWLGILGTMFPFVEFFSAPFWGDVSDKWGRRRGLQITLLGTIAAHLISALAILTKDIYVLLFSRAIAGFFCGNIAICVSTLADISPDEKLRSQRMGYMTIGLGAGWMIAMLVGGVLSDPKVLPFFTLSTPFYIAAILATGAYFVVQFLFSETYVPKETSKFNLLKSFREMKDALKIPKLRPLFLGLFIWSLGWFPILQWFTPLSMQSYHVSITTVYYYLLFLGFAWLLGGYLNSIIVNYISSFKLIILSIPVAALFIFLGSLASSYWLFTLCFWLATLVSPISACNLFAHISSSASSEIQGKVNGFGQAFQAFAAILVPLLAGKLASLKIGLVYPVAAALLFIAFLVLALYRKPNDAQNIPS